MASGVVPLTAGRRSGAPRLIDWTGERCVPWAPDIQVVYEHLHRYLWASRLVGGRSVLELASGEGFGAAILARSADRVTGIDIDKLTVDHSCLNYGSDRISFRVGDARDLSQFPDASFGAVVAFEMIEHVDDQDRVLAEAARVLEPDGLLIMSTPDRRVYSGAGAAANPFHVRELDLEEFRAMLGSSFDHVRIWGQRTITGSALADLAPPPGAAEVSKTFFVARDGDNWQLAGGLSPMYLVAVASRAPLPPVPNESNLADAQLQLLHRTAQAGEEALVAAQRQAEEDGRQAVAERKQLLQECAELRRALDERDVELSLGRDHLVASWAETSRLGHELDIAQRQSAEMRHSITWKAYRRGRTKIFDALGGERSVAVKMIQASVRGVSRLHQLQGHRAGATQLPIGPGVTLPAFPDPRVSLVIPLYSGAGLTEACLRSISAHTSGTSYEVIVVDDAADAETKALLRRVEGARVLVNRENIGYLRSVNRGAAVARGEWLVLCNNDIEVGEGWLEALMDCVQSWADVGVVTPKYLFPDGSLNEAGGIIWRDGTGMNYGRHDRPERFQYGFRREVDYGSAAALMVRASFWRQSGGFDELFLPMYYEDVDLCFRAREQGLRVVYEPRAQVVHIEGGTAGIDIASGHKRFQEVNRSRFVEKWEARLADHARNDVRNARAAANRASGRRVLIADHRVPMWDRDAGSLRMKAMIESFLELGCRVTFLPDDRGHALPYGPAFEADGVEVWHGDVNVHAELAAIGSELSLAVLSRPHTTARWLDLVRGLAPGAAVVYDTVDLHWLREARRATAGAASGTAADVAYGSRAAALRELERALFRACDATLVVSREEADLVQDDAPGSPVWVVPVVNAVRRGTPGVAGRRGVVFVGGFEHPPNIDAAVRIVKEIMPLVWHRHGPVPVTIVGGSPPKEVLDLASGEVEITGWLPEVEPALDQARAMLAPLSWGAGLKGKVTQALASGLPVVTTSVGAEGLDATDGREILIADTDEALADRVVAALTDDALWVTLSAAGKDRVDELCSPRMMRDRMRELLDAGPRLRAGRPRSPLIPQA